MATIRLNPRINFFATSDELAIWVGEWVRRHGLVAALTRHPPTVITLDVPWGDAPAAARLLREHTRVFLRLTPIWTDVPNVNSLSEANPDMLSIILPEQTATDLSIGTFGTGTKDRTPLKVWRAVGRDFLSRTAGGLWGVFPGEGDPDFARNYRYSPGAEQLWRSGVLLLGFGDETWHIEKPAVPGNNGFGRSVQKA